MPLHARKWLASDKRDGQTLRSPIEHRTEKSLNLLVDVAVFVIVFVKTLVTRLVAVETIDEMIFCVVT